MENYKDENYSSDLKNKINRELHEEHRNFDSRSGRVLAGLVLVAIGGLIFADRAGVDIPRWVFSWEMILIGVGIYIGARRSFRPGGWMVPILIGLIFLAEEWWLDFREIGPYLWPSFFIAIGLYMIFKPRRNRANFWDSHTAASDISSEDAIDAVSIFGGTRKNIISKAFKGGEITTFFGGTELNLMQADITGSATIEITQAFGGTKLMIPPHWNIKSEIVCVFGGISDKRPLSNDTPDSGKLLILKGTCVFGGIDIKSY
jgi:predicted membrane protein